MTAIAAPTGRVSFFNKGLLPISLLYISVTPVASSTGPVSYQQAPVGHSGGLPPLNCFVPHIEKSIRAKRQLEAGVTETLS